MGDNGASKIEVKEEPLAFAALLEQRAPSCNVGYGGRQSLPLLSDAFGVSGVTE